MKRPIYEYIAVLLAIFMLLTSIGLLVYAQASWPAPWIQVDWDKTENGPHDDWRDVEYAYYQFDSCYLYLKLKCYDLPGKDWEPAKKEKARYKWFIDLDGDLHHGGGNIFGAEYLLFVEDTNQDGVGEIFLLYDSNHDGKFSEYQPWPPADYAIYKITDSNVGGYRIVAPYQIEMYISWVSLGNPPSYWIDWATDQQNPNLDQGPTTDHRDEEQPMVVHNVAALTQIPSSTIVTQGDHASIQVVVQDWGTHAESFDVTCYFDTSIVGTLPVSNLAAGHSATLYFDWDTTGVPAGTYNIKAWADSGSVIVESDETDNWCYATAAVTITVHDVAAISQDPDQTSVPQGTIVKIDVTVLNLGGFTETFDVTCYYDGTKIGTQTVTNVAPSSARPVFFEWNTAGVPEGTYYIKALADSAYAIAEANEYNNECTGPTPVTVYKPGKLFVDKAKTAIISGPEPPVVDVTTVYELTITVTNGGSNDITSVVVEDTISSDITYVGVGTPSQGTVTATPPLKIVWNVGTLHLGDSATLTFRVSLNPTATGVKYLNRKGDLSASGKTDGTPVSDTGRTDVTATPTIRDVTASSQAPSSTVVNQGETVSIKVELRNLGDQIESFDTTCYYDSTPITPIGKLRAYSLASGDSKILTFSWDTTGVALGTYTIRAWADSSTEVSESDETNNECTNAAAVEIVIHDVAAISQTPSPTTVQAGGTVTVLVVVGNQGIKPETFTVDCHYDGSQIGTTQTVNNLAPSTSTTLTFIWQTTGVAPGTYYISAVASTVPGETDTNDNSCNSVTTVTVYVPAVPGKLCVDKAKTAVISGLDPPPVGKTTVYELTITVTNIGGSDVINVIVEDTISSDVTYVSVGTPSLGAVTATPPPKIVWSVGTLAHGASATLAFRVSLTPATSGLKYLNHKEDVSAVGITQGQPISDNGDTDVTAVAISPAPPVGGKWVPINKFTLLGPWISLGSATVLITALFVYIKRKKKQMS